MAKLFKLIMSKLNLCMFVRDEDSKFDKEDRPLYLFPEPGEKLRTGAAYIPIMPA